MDKRLGRPMSKNCPRCGKFMAFCWVEEGSNVWNEIVKKTGLPACAESIAPAFYCSVCNEWDHTFVDPKHYQWLIYKGTINFKEAKKELPRPEYVALLAELREMRRLFLSRPFLALPILE